MNPQWKAKQEASDHASARIHTYRLCLRAAVRAAIGMQRSKPPPASRAPGQCMHCSQPSHRETPPRHNPRRLVTPNFLAFAWLFPHFRASLLLSKRKQTVQHGW